MDITILVLWLSFNNGTVEAYIHSIEFKNTIACEYALRVVREKSRRINGVCVLK